MSSLFASVSPNHLIHLTVSCILPACYLQTFENASPASGYDWSSFLCRIPDSWPLLLASFSSRSSHPKCLQPWSGEFHAAATQDASPHSQPGLTPRSPGNKVHPGSPRHLLPPSPFPEGTYSHGIPDLASLPWQCPFSCPSLANGCISVLEPV